MPKKKTPKKMSANKKRHFDQPSHSHIDSKGRIYLKHAGGYHEFTKSAIGKFPGSTVGD